MRRISKTLGWQIHRSYFCRQISFVHLRLLRRSRNASESVFVRYTHFLHKRLAMPTNPSLRSSILAYAKRL
jgi:hypothetical protein